MRSLHTATKSSPCSLQLEKTHTQQRIPNAAKNKLKIKKKICLHVIKTKNEGEIHTFPNEQKLKEFITTRLVPQEMLKGVLKVKMKEHQKAMQTHIKV